MLRHQVIHHEHCAGAGPNNLNDLLLLVVAGQVSILESSAELQQTRVGIAVQRLPRWLAEAVHFFCPNMTR
jgi:hypothetical protein